MAALWLDWFWFDWLSLLVRWFHVVAGVAWIGASFYFIWLDLSLEPPNEEQKKRGIKGQLSSIHGGGFYEVAKYQLAPPELPTTLHWFKWEAYTTWLTGFVLLTLLYYFNADAYLMDAEKWSTDSINGIILSIASIVLSWIIYDGLCRSPIAKMPWCLAVVLFLLISAIAWGLNQLFSDRATYLHIGVIIGTCMAANVYFVIIPGQKALVDAVKKGGEPNPKFAAASKIRSVHNNYLTLPLLFLMISNHYSGTYGHEHSVAILMAIIILGAWTRHFFNLQHQGQYKPGILVSSVLGFMALAWFAQPINTVSFAEVPEEQNTKIEESMIYAIVESRCASCHSRSPSDDVFVVAPSGVYLQTKEDIQRWKPRIYQRVVISKDMPFANKTVMTERERNHIARWYQAAKTP